MAVLVIGKIPELSPDDYTFLMEASWPAMNQAPGFILHTAHPLKSGGYKTFEIWNSQEECNEFFAVYVAKYVPAKFQAKRRTQSVSVLLRGVEQGVARVAHAYDRG